MAIVQNFWLKGASKRLAGAVIYEAMGQTRARQLASSVSNPRTEAQMNQRIRWANAVSFYRANASWMKYAFETKKANQSEYNKFMSVNVTASPIALTKSAAAAGACVVAPYIVTQGSLPSIEWQDAGTSLASNIFVAPTKQMSAYTTVGEFAADLIQYNAAMREGDQLSLIRFSQLTNASTGYPYIIVRKYEVLLDTTSAAPLTDYLPADYLQAPGLAQDNAIYVAKESRQGGFVMILSRTIGGKTYVSTQSVVIVNNETLISQYSSAAAIAEAIASYGESSEAFLSTVSANTVSSQPIVNSINYAIVGGRTLRPGDTTPTGNGIGPNEMTLFFTQPIETTGNISCKLVFLTSGTSLTATGTLTDGNKVSFSVYGDITTTDYGNHINYMSATIDGVEYRINFAPSSTYTQEGLD